MRRRVAVPLLAGGLAAVGVAALWHGGRSATRTPSPRARRGSLELAILGIAALFLDQWYQPFVQPFVDAYNWISGPVASAFKAALDALKDLLLGIIDALRQAFWYAFDLLQTFVNFVLSVAWTAIQLATGIATMLLEALWNSVTWILSRLADVAGQIWGTILSLDAWIIGQVGDLLSRILSGIDYVLNWVWKNVFQPLLNALGQLLGYVLGVIQSALKWIYSTFLEPILNFLASLADKVGALWNFVFGIVATVVHAVLDAFDWILWFGRHTLASIAALINDAGHGGAHVLIEMVVNALVGAGDTLEELLANMFG